MSTIIRPTRVEATIDDLVDMLPQHVLDNLTGQLADNAEVELDRYGNYINVCSEVQVPVADVLEDIFAQDSFARHLRAEGLAHTIVNTDDGSVELVWA